MHWYTDGVLILVVLLMVLYHLAPISFKRRKKLVFWTFFVYCMYVFVLLLTFFSLAVLELTNASP